MEKKLFMSVVLPAAMVFATSAFAEEERIQWTDVPPAVQKTITDHAGGGKIEEIEKETNGIMADMIIETSGSAAGARQALSLVKKSGRIALEGMYQEPVSIDLNKVVQWNIQMAGGKAEGEFVLDRIVPLMEDGRIVTEPILTHEFALEDINEAMNTYVNRVGGAIKVVVKP